MLQQLRKASKSPVATVVIGVLVLAFALWGVADIFRGGADTVVADVGSTQISDVEYDLQLKNQMRALSQQTGTDITLEQAKAMGLDRNVLDASINRAALDERSRELGLVASRATIEAQFVNDPAFRGASGAFDPFLLQRALQDSGYTVDGFYAQTGEDVTRRQMITGLINGIQAPPGLTRLLHDFYNEQRTIEYLIVSPEEAGQVPEPTQADLEAFHMARGNDLFSSPEYRAFDYVTIRPDEVAKEIELSDAEVRTEYDSNKAQYEVAEQRDIEQIVFPDKAQADAAAARIKTAEDFTTVARERGLSADDVKLGTFTQGSMDARLSPAAFQLAEGASSPPVQGQFGWVILRAAKVTPGQSRTFEEVEGQIRQNLTNQRARARMLEIANAYEDDRASGDTIADAAMKHGLIVRQVVAADRNGMTPEGGVADIPLVPDFLEAAFEMETGDEGDLFETTEGGAYAIKMNSITPPAVRPLDQVREQVREVFIEDARSKLLQTRMQTFADEARRTGTLAEAGRALRRAPTASMALRRGQADNVVSAALNQQIFGAQQGAIITGAAPSGGGQVLARVVSVAHPEPDVSAMEYEQFRQTAAQQLSETIVDTMAMAGRTDAGVTVHDATLSRILGELPPLQ
jgi:peptidyl-prolyl cis-trans isomerase D